jgi:antitoxin MazE
MQAKIQKWGNSLAIRIPKALASAAGIEPGTTINLSVVNGKLVLERIAEPEYSLDELLAKVTKHNIHREIDTGAPVGKEVW